MRSKAALLLVLVAKKQGLQAVQELLPQLLNAAKESTTHTEMVGALSTLFFAGITMQAMGCDLEHAGQHAPYLGTIRRVAQQGDTCSVQLCTARRRGSPSAGVHGAEAGGGGGDAVLG